MRIAGDSGSADFPTDSHTTATGDAETSPAVAEVCEVLHGTVWEARTVAATLGWRCRRRRRRRLAA